MKLLPSQKTSILEDAEKLFLKPSDFEFLFEDRLGEVVTLRFNGLDDEFYFTMEDLIKLWHIKMVPGVDEYYESRSIEPRFTSANHLIWAWLQGIKREIDAQSRYSDLLNPKNYIPFEEIFDENERFSEDEIIALKAQAQKLNARLATLGLNEYQVQELKQHITEAVGKAHSHSKIDWKNMFVGMIFTQLFELGIESNVANQIWEGVGQFIFIGKLLLNQ